MFWLVCGLASAYIRAGTSLLETDDGRTGNGSSTEYSVDLRK